MRPELLALIVPVALALQYARKRRPPVRNYAAEVLRWWGLEHGLNDARRPQIASAEAPEPGFDPLDVMLGMQQRRVAVGGSAVACHHAAGLGALPHG